MFADQLFGGKETMLAIESLHVCDEFDSGSSGCRNDMLETKPSTIKRKCVNYVR